MYNAQGDVVGLADSSGKVVVEYTYDAWGNPLSITGTLASTLGQFNPLRYRGYVWDGETGLYYLQSRYYNPSWGRWINGDSQLNPGQMGKNMFAYCYNNPVNMADFFGQNPIAIVAGAGITLAEAALITVCVVAIVYLCTPEGQRTANSMGEAISDALTDSWTGVVNTVKVVGAILAPASISLSIDWNGGDTNHILNGTKGNHVPGWKKFGIDPKNSKAWGLLLPILKEVVDKGKEYLTKILPDGAKVIYYTKYYADKGVDVIVKIWVSADGTVKKISDAWTNTRWY